MVKGLVGVTYKELLRILGLFSLYKTRGVNTSWPESLQATGRYCVWSPRGTMPNIFRSY